jgi:hypothetical protein
MDYQVKWSGTTTNAVATELFLATGLRYPIGYNAVCRIEGTALASSAGLASKEWSWSLLIKNVAGVVSIVGDVLLTELFADAGAATWVLGLAADDTNNALAVTVTGQAGTTITWSVYGNVDTIGSTTVVSSSSRLTVPQLIELIRLHHPTATGTIIAQMLSTAQTKFVMETRCNAKTSRLAMAGTLVGTTSLAPLTITGGLYGWEFYKDDTVPTITMNPNANVMFYRSFATHNSSGTLIKSYSVDIRHDKSVSIYDGTGAELADLDGEVATMTIDFIKQPAALVVASTSIPEIDISYHEALSHSVISELYMTRTDMPMLDRLQISKHYQNLYKEIERRAKKGYHYQSSMLTNRNYAACDFALSKQRSTSSISNEE